jgi:Fe-S-cluster containining protein
MKEDREKACPFVTDKGCAVYADRPTACRLYPLGRVSGKGSGDSSVEPYYYQMDTPSCLGISELHVWAVKEWEANQGLQEYLEMNDRMLEIVYHPVRDRRSLLDERQIQKVMVACYNPDVFREFIQNAHFSDVFSLDKDTLHRAMSDDRALLELGMAFLSGTLFSKKKASGTA